MTEAEKIALIKMISEFHKVGAEYYKHNNLSADFLEKSLEYKLIAEKNKEKMFQLAEWLNQHDLRRNKDGTCVINWIDSANLNEKWAQRGECSICGRKCGSHELLWREQGERVCKDTVFCEITRKQKVK